MWPLRRAQGWLQRNVSTAAATDFSGGCRTLGERGPPPSNCILMSRAGGRREELEGSEASSGIGRPEGHATKMRPKKGRLGAHRQEQWLVARDGTH